MNDEVCHGRSEWTASNYSYVDEVAEASVVYRVHIIDVNGKDHYSNIGGDTTGINELEGQGSTNGTKLYRLDGRQAQQSRGLYIEKKNGQTHKRIIH